MNRQRVQEKMARLTAELKDLKRQLRTVKCAYCRQEFTSQRTLRGDWPCCGTYSCRSRESVRRTEKMRQRQEQELLALAARHWPHWKESYGPRNYWLASQVNAHWSGRHITKNWVTRHQEEIEHLL